jgi:hypothetical protein
MIDTTDWINNTRIDLQNRSLDMIQIPELKTLKEYPEISFNTELFFDNCIIEGINASCLYLGEKFIIQNCTINKGLGFYATYFFGGLEIRNCIIKGDSTFNSGVHNNYPNNFIIDSCTFEGYVDFWDVYFGWSAIITNNKFLKGTNIGIYGKVNKEGAEFICDNNEGNIKLVTDDDPFYGSKRKKTSP